MSCKNIRMIDATSGKGRDVAEKQFVSPTTKINQEKIMWGNAKSSGKECIDLM